jgi:hypothetical protein
MILGTLNIRSTRMYWELSLKTVTEEIPKYKLDLVGEAAP